MTRGLRTGGLVLAALVLAAVLYAAEEGALGPGAEALAALLHAVLLCCLLWFGMPGLRAMRETATGATPVTPEEAWDNGCRHGLDIAWRTVATYPKPYITAYEERGWLLARRQLAEAVDDVRTPA